MSENMVSPWRVCFMVAAAIGLLFVFVDLFVLKAYEIPSSSMSPTLLRGDQVLTSPLVYRFGIRQPKRGDVIVFQREEVVEFAGRLEMHLGHFVKRVVGVPGDVVEVRDDRTFVNGYETFEEEYINITPRPDSERKALRDFGPVKLEEGEFFVLGDNRTGSQDSRIFGPVRSHEIIGRAFLIYWSSRNDREVEGVRWERLGQWIR